MAGTSPEPLPVKRRHRHDRASSDARGVTVRPISLEHSWATWSDVARRQDNVFSTWEWAWAWWDAHGRDRRLLVHEVRDAEDRPIGILPLYVARERPSRLLRFIGHGAGDQLGPVCAPADRERVAAALQLVVADLAGSRGMLLAEGLRADQGWAHTLRGTPVRRQSFPLVRLEGVTWDAWLASKSANFRQQTRRRERRLTKVHDLRFRLAQDERERAVAFRTLVELHEARWNGASSAFDEDNLRLHSLFTKLAAERGWLRLWTADLDGRPAAAWLGYRFGGSDAYHQMGRDPARDDTSIGSVLLMHTVRDALEAGSQEYRMLRGGERYKGRLQSEDPGVETWIVGAGVGSTVAAAVLRNRGRVPRPLRVALRAGLRW